MSFIDYCRSSFNSGKRRVYFTRHVTTVFVISLLMSNNASAGVFDNIRSMDTTPVDFFSNGTHYRIPRNYLTEMDHWNGGPQESVTLKLTYPDLRPYSKETEASFVNWPGYILTVSMLLGLSESEDGFENMIKIMDDKNPDQGPFGFEHYKVGPPEARINFYKKTAFGRVIIFDCTPFDNHGTPDGLCHHVTRTRSGAIISYFFQRGIWRRLWMSMRKSTISSIRFP